MFGEVDPPKGDRNGRIGWPVIKSKVCVGRDAQRGRCIVAGGKRHVPNGCEIASIANSSVERS